MAPISPIPKPAIPLTGSSKGLPAKGRIELPVSGQNVPHNTSVSTGTIPAVSETIRQTAKVLNEFAGKMRRNLHFRIDEMLDRTVITVVDAETEEVIRQIPPEEVLSLARHLERDMSAILHIVV